MQDLKKKFTKLFLQQKMKKIADDIMILNDAINDIWFNHSFVAHDPALARIFDFVRPKNTLGENLKL